MRGGLALAILVFVALAWAPLVVSGPAMLSSDETQAYVQARALMRTGPAELPYFNDVGGAFASMGAGERGGNVDGGVSPLFVAIGAPATYFGVLGVETVTILFGLALIVAAYVLVREAAGDRAATISALLLAVSPPILFWSGFDMANVPTAACFVASLAMMSLYFRRERLPWALGALVLAVAAVAMRRDALPLIVPFLAILALAARRRPALWAAVALGAYAAVAGFRVATGLSRSVGDAVLLSAADVGDTWSAILDKFFGYHGGFVGSIFFRNLADHALGVATIAAIAGALGVAVRFAKRRAALVLATLLVTGLGYFLASMTITDHIVADPPGVFSSLVRYALLGFVSMTILVALGLSRLAPRFGRAAMTALVLLLVVGSGLQGVLAEPGVAWAANERARRAEIVHAASELPPNSILVGDEISKFVTDVPVLVPNDLWPLERTYTVPMLDRLADRYGVRAFVHRDAFEGDWTGPLGEFVTSRHRAAQETRWGPFLEIVWTNTTLARVGILSEDGWRLDASQRLVTAAPLSTFRPTPVLGDELVSVPSPAVLVRATAIDGDVDAHAMGYVNAPGTPNDVRIERAWTGTGTGAPIAHEFFLPANTIVNGPFFVSGGLTLTGLEIVPLPGLVEP